MLPYITDDGSDETTYDGTDDAYDEANRIAAAITTDDAADGNPNDAANEPAEIGSTTTPTKPSVVLWLAMLPYITDDGSDETA